MDNNYNNNNYNDNNNGRNYGDSHSNNSNYNSSNYNSSNYNSSNFNNGNNDNNAGGDNSAYNVNRYAQPDFTFYNGNTYQKNGYQAYSPYDEPKRWKKEKRERKPGGFFSKLVKCTALALVFGLVSGSVMVGVQYAATPWLEKNGKGDAVSSGQQTIQNEGNGTIESTAVSNTYVAVDVSDIVDEVMPSIVAITNISETEYRSFWGSQVYESSSAGSGIIISSDDEYLYIATNNHVIDGAKSLTVTFVNDATVSAEVKGADPSIDLAVVKVAIKSIESTTMDVIKMASLGDSDSLRVGEASIAIGNALGYGQSVTMGVISALNREVTVADSSSSTGYTAELIQTDAAINPGNSGGALLNSRGQVIGINSVKYADTDVEGIGYAIPMSTAAPIIQELITKEKVDESNSSYLGIGGIDVTSEVSSTYNMPTGVYVAQVFENTAAEQGGIIPGDIITKFDGKTITSMDTLTGTLQYYPAGSKVEVTIMRSHNGQYQEQVLEIVLGKKN